MQFDIQWIDVTPFLVAQQQPVVMVPRPKAHHQQKAWAGNTQVAHLGEFWVPQGPIIGGDIQWSLTKTGELVRVPVFAYKTSRALASLFGVGLQIGLAALAELRKHTPDVPVSATLVLGHECTDLAVGGEDAFRCYAGVCIRTK